MAMYELTEIGREDYLGCREQIKKYASKTLFHEPAWLEYLERTGKGAPKYFEIVCNNNNKIGYFVFLEVKLGPFKIMGSPLPGWTTNYMGPIINEDVNQRELILSIKKLIRNKRYVYTEIKSDILKKELMQEAGFVPLCDQTAVFDVPKNEEDAWKKMSGFCRNRIRKGMKNSLEVEEVDNPSILEEYYDMIVARYREQGMEFPFSIDRLKILWDCLNSQGRILVLRVSRNGETAAVGLFPFDEKCIYYFGGASKSEANSLCPNELMHWSAIRKAQQLGIQKYNMCGTSRFKRKFGTEDVPFISYIYSPIPGFYKIRNTIYGLYWKQLKIRRLLKGN
jgi:hypothetical protein